MLILRVSIRPLIIDQLPGPTPKEGTPTDRPASSTDVPTARESVQGATTRGTPGGGRADGSANNPRQRPRRRNNRVPDGSDPPTDCAAHTTTTRASQGGTGQRIAPQRIGTPNPARANGLAERARQATTGESQGATSGRIHGQRIGAPRQAPRATTTRVPNGLDRPLVWHAAPNQRARRRRGRLPNGLDLCLLSDSLDHDARVFRRHSQCRLPTPRVGSNVCMAGSDGGARRALMAAYATLP